jgi:hypothetical protein
MHSLVPTSPLCASVLLNALIRVHVPHADTLAPHHTLFAQSTQRMFLMLLAATGLALVGWEVYEAHERRLSHDADHRG